MGARSARPGVRRKPTPGSQVMRGSPRARGRGHDGDETGGGAGNRLLALKLRARSASRCAKARTAAKEAAYGCKEGSRGERRQPAPRSRKRDRRRRLWQHARLRRDRRLGRAIRRLGLRFGPKFGAQDRGRARPSSSRRRSRSDRARCRLPPFAARALPAPTCYLGGSVFTSISISCPKLTPKLQT